MVNTTENTISSSPSGRLGGAEMFNAIAFRYDLLNQLLSFGIHKRWRRKAIRFLNSSLAPRPSSPTLLDIATGTADFAIDAIQLQPKKIIGVDISEDMLAIGRKKIEKKNLSHVIELKKVDSENLPFENNSFDAATVSFGVRNFDNLEKGLAEICRVMKTGGALVVLEFSIPQKFPMKQLYNIYLQNICPFIGKIISKNAVAYSYLFESVKNFPYGDGFKQKLLECGFSDVKFFPQTFGVTTIYLAKK